MAALPSSGCWIIHPSAYSANAVGAEVEGNTHGQQGRTGRLQREPGKLRAGALVPGRGAGRRARSRRARGAAGRPGPRTAPPALPGPPGPAQRTGSSPRAGRGRPRRAAPQRRGRSRPGLATVFGEVTVRRLAYRRRGHANLHPADAALNLPAERHSHGLRRLAAEEASRGSLDDATATIRRGTGTELGKRQVEQLAARAATDVEEFYASRRHRAVDPGDVLVLS